MKYIFKFVNIIFFCIILQVTYFFALITVLGTLSPYIYIVLSAAGIFTAFFIATGTDNAVYRQAWIIPILLLPAVFGPVYAFYNRRVTGRAVEADIITIRKKTAPFTEGGGKSMNIKQTLTADYIYKTAGFPHTHANSVYFPSGEDFYKALLDEIKAANRYIFIEMFIIEQGVMWSEILYILTEKARQGLDVRVIYDGAGSAYSLPYGYHKTLRKAGIKCVVFNPFRPLLSVRFNVSNHRKIISVDGKTAFCGGANFSDEYINKKPNATTGHWKDSAVMIRGAAAWNVTLMFLSMWEFVSRCAVDFIAYKPVLSNDGAHGSASVWCDVPLDNTPVSQRLYMGIIMRAERYVYITTPYLIPPDEIMSALCLQAQSGVDVRIVLPFIADKYLVHTVTKTFYSELLESGVKIYEYAPGFIHSKNIMADGTVASVSTLNMDFRSFYMHYECGVCIYDSGTIADMEADFEKTLVSCKEITLTDYRRAGLFRRGFRRVCRILIPLL